MCPFSVMTGYKSFSTARGASACPLHSKTNLILRTFSSDSEDPSHQFSVLENFGSLGVPGGTDTPPISQIRITDTLIGYLTRGKNSQAGYL